MTFMPIRGNSLIPAALLLLVLAHNADAADKGAFMLGGGVGSLPCTKFLDDMQTARARGGIRSTEGVNLISPFMMYVAGFQTAYNYKTSGIKNVFDRYSSDQGFGELIALEKECSNSPNLKFAEALLVFADREAAKVLKK